MTESAVFFSRCRPQESNPIDLVLKERRVFIGYPAFRIDVEPRRGHLRETIVDLRCSDEEWEKLRPSFDKNQKKQYQQNRNFIQSIERGAIALVPRPDRGVVYAGRVVAPFELIDNPPWGDAYLAFRRDHGLKVEDEFGHLGDVAQCCEVDQFRPIPFPLIPAWIRRSLLGRSTYGQIWPLSVLDLKPYPVLDRLLVDPRREELPWTDNAIEVERRLVDAVGPNTFEHLCIALLQLEHPEHIWSHVGGSGDGGVDGVGAANSGEVVGLLQCKWAYSGEEVVVASSISERPIRQILAALLHPPSVPRRENVEFWSRSDIASLIIRHASKLPIALSLRIRAA